MTEYDLLLWGDVWDAERGRERDRWVGVDDGTIACVTPDRPGEAERVLKADLFTPGLVDLHVHLVWDGSADPVATLRAEDDRELAVRAVGNAAAQLRGGVTTVRDLGSVNDVAIAVRDAVRRGQVPGPRIHASGRTVVITGGHDPFWGIHSDGVDECVAAVRELRSNGADLIKVSATGGVYGQAVGEAPGVAELSRTELAAIVDEAHRFGLPVAAHAVGTEGIANAVAAGVDTIEHGNLMDNETLDRLVEDGVGYDPTLYVYREIATGSAEIPTYARENAESVYERHAEVFRTARDRGARLLAGSDAGSPETPHPALSLELEALVDAGLDPEAALKAATLTNASELGRPELGTLTPGTPADVVGFDDDPMDDVAATRNPTVIVQGGMVVDPTATPESLGPR